MTLMELYYGLKSGKIKLRENSGLCHVIAYKVSLYHYLDFDALFMSSTTSTWLDDRGIFTPERETFLLLFAAYKGEL